MTCFVTSLAVMLNFFDAYTSLIGAFVAAFVESLPKSVDDNLTVTPAVATVLFLKSLL